MAKILFTGACKPTTASRPPLALHLFETAQDSADSRAVNEGHVVHQKDEVFQARPLLKRRGDDFAKLGRRMEIQFAVESDDQVSPKIFNDALKGRFLPWRTPDRSRPSVAGGAQVVNTFRRKSKSPCRKLPQRYDFEAIIGGTFRLARGRLKFLRPCGSWGRTPTGCRALTAGGRCPESNGRSCERPTLSRRPPARSRGPAPPRRRPAWPPDEPSPRLDGWERLAVS